MLQVKDIWFHKFDSQVQIKTQHQQERVKKGKWHINFDTGDG